jgi:hypothetical protein
MHSSRQSDTNSEQARYAGYSGAGNTSYNINMNSLNNPANPSHYYAHTGGGNGYPITMDKTYSCVTTEPVIVRQDQPLIIVDPICEPHVKSYLTWSLFNVFCCCIFGGIATVIMSCNVKRLNDNLQYKEAYSKAWKVLLANIIITAVGTFTWLVAFPYIYMAIYPYLPKINY